MTSYPERGPGAVAGIGVRIGAFLIDSVIANLVVGVVFLAGWDPGGLRGWLVYGVFLLMELLFVSTGGQTPGMAVLGAGVVRFPSGGGAAPPGGGGGGGGGALVPPAPPGRRRGGPGPAPARRPPGPAAPPP